MVQAGKNGDCTAVQQLKMQGIGKAPQQHAAKPGLVWWKGFWSTRELFSSSGNDAQKIPTQTVRLLLVPLKCLCDFSLSRWFEFDNPAHKFTPSDCAISNRLLPCLG